MIQMIRSKRLISMATSSDMKVSLTFMNLQCAEYSARISILHFSPEFRHQSFM